ncbi:hypothetical protein BFW38_03640 [Terasakiispira papahanaumokuakeensis]|uniref:Uncharacterized protein n=1 Tax=Terasakiispira papahanaumokuakeensis TaxID=197479 RepID=A0A1E2V6Y6_9GAMM|nr:hypothetical protein [Terasakiispira papahanaumokuakeensis]ODC02770.1 hypothetical protein BFW38_03640 [Terasakiispira papahanaumokuakeensis]
MRRQVHSSATRDATSQAAQRGCLSNRLRYCGVNGIKALCQIGLCIIGLSLQNVSTLASETSASETSAAETLTVEAQQARPLITHTGQTNTLPLPRPLNAGESLILVLEVSALQPGQSIIISQPSGQFIGEVTPFGPQARRTGGTYLIPITSKPGADHISFQIQRSSNHTPAATPLQHHNVKTYIKRMELRILPATPQ